MWPYSRREPPIRDGFAKMQMVYNNYTIDQLRLPDHICTFLNLEGNPLSSAIPISCEQLETGPRCGTEAAGPSSLKAT